MRSLLDDPRVFDAVIVLLATWFLLSAYLVAWAYVITPQGVASAASAGLVAVSASWFALTGFLFFASGRGLDSGRPWNRALPDGYVGTLPAALVTAAAGGLPVVISYCLDLPFAISHRRPSPARAGSRAAEIGP